MKPSCKTRDSGWFPAKYRPGKGKGDRWPEYPGKVKTGT